MADITRSLSEIVVPTETSPKHVGAVVSVVESSTLGKDKTVWWRWLVGLVWDSVEGDARNRRYVQKLDWFLLFVPS